MPRPSENDYTDYNYPEPLLDPPQISAEILQKHIDKISPYKAHSPDDIPNIVIKQCTAIIQAQLLQIVRAIVELGIYHDP